MTIIAAVFTLVKRTLLGKRKPGLVSLRSRKRKARTNPLIDDCGMPLSFCPLLWILLPVLTEVFVAGHNAPTYRHIAAIPTKYCHQLITGIYPYYSYTPSQPPSSHPSEASGLL